MTKLEQCRAELEDATIRGKRFIDEGNMPAAAIVAEEIRIKRAQYDRELEAHRADESAARNLPAPAMASPGGGWRGVADQIRSAAETGRRTSIRFGEMEVRAITANGAGVNTVPGVMSGPVDGGKLRSLVSVFTGKDSQSVVPVFSPHLAIPVGTAPGATGTASDTTAVLAGKSLTLNPWYSTLPVSMGALISTDIEARLPTLFGEAFGAAIDKMIAVGAGTGQDGLGVYVANATGVPTGSDIACAASGAPKWLDMIGLAGTILGLGGDLSKAAILINPTLVGNLLSESTASTEGLKMELLTRGTIRGIKVIESTYCPTTLTAGSYVCVGGYFDKYALAVAQEITIDPIKTVGADNVTFQAFMYMQGWPMIGGSFRRLKTV